MHYLLQILHSLFLTCPFFMVSNKSTNKFWRRCGERGTLLHCWCECKLVQLLWKAVWRYLKRFKMDLPFDPATPLLAIFPKEPKKLIWKNISTPMFIAVLYNHQDMEAAQVSISRWVNKTTMGHLHNGILLCCKKEDNFTLCNNIERHEEHYGKSNKPVR